MGEASAVNRTLYTATAVPVPAGGRLPSGRGCRTRLPPLDGGRSAGRGRGARLDHRRCRRARVPRRGRRRHRRRRRARPRRRSPQVMAEQAGRVAFAHGSAFTTEPLEAYAAEVGAHLPMDDPAIYPVSGGSEAIETALKIARAYHLARGEPGPLDRHRPLGQLPRQHPRRARPVRPPAAPPAVRGVARAVPARVRGLPVSRRRAGRERPRRRRGARRRAGAGDRGGRARDGRGVRRRARSSGATLAAAVPPEGYWPAIAEVCRRHGVLLIADEVMTGFGRTGRWFGSDHWGVRPDILVAAKGATSGYWPFGFVAASGAIHDAVTGAPAAFVHGFTYSHHAGRRRGGPRGAADPRGRSDLVEASAAKGERLRTLLSGALGEHPARRRDPRPRPDGRRRAGRGPGDAARRSRAPRGSPRRSSAARASAGVLVYSGTGLADGTNGDSILLGPPFVITDEELQRVAEVLADAVDEAAASLGADVGLTVARTGRAPRVPAPLTPVGARRCPSGASRRGRSAAPGRPSRRMSGSAMFDAADQREQPPNQSCQPQPPPLSARTAAMNRNATPKQNVPDAVDVVADPRRVQDARHGQGGDERAGVERAVPRSISPLDRGTRARPRGRPATPAVRPAGSACWISSSAAEDHEEDADPRETRPAVLVRAPLPGVDMDAALPPALPASPGASPAAVGAESCHRLSSMGAVAPRAVVVRRSRARPVRPCRSAATGGVRPRPRRG